MIKQVPQHNQGFTLLEVVVALGLLIMVFGGVTGLAILSTEAAKSSKNNLIASYLAKEAMELVRYRRDLNYILTVSPFDQIATESDTAVYNFNISYTGTIDPAGTDVTQTPALVTSSNFYTQALATTTTRFRRLVTTTYHVAAGPLPAYIEVRVEVYWNEDTRHNTYTLTGELSDWR